MARIDVRHESGDRFAIAIRGHRLVVDQPLNAGGRDDGPTPTELFVASLASCVAFYAGRFLRRHGVAAGELEVTSEFTMSSDPLWRVDTVAIELRVPAHLSDELCAGALRAAEQCTVHSSLRWAPRVGLTIAALEPIA